MEKEFISGVMDKYLLEIDRIIKLKDKELCSMHLAECWFPIFQKIKHKGLGI